MSELLTAEQARSIASKENALDYVLKCVLRRIKMVAEKGGFKITFTIKFGDLFDANDAIAFKMGLDDGLELQTDLIIRFISKHEDKDMFKNKLESLGFDVNSWSWQSDHYAGGESITISWENKKDITNG